MTKKKLIKLVYENLEKQYTQKEISSIVDAFLDAIKSSLITKGKVLLVGFGTFTLNERKSYIGRNPQTSEIIKIAAKKKIHFKPGKTFVNSVNEEA